MSICWDFVRDFHTWVEWTAYRHSAPAESPAFHSGREYRHSRRTDRGISHFNPGGMAADRQDAGPHVQAVDETEPTLLQAGDHVHFYAVSEEEFNQIKEAETVNMHILGNS